MRAMLLEKQARIETNPLRFTTLPTPVPGEGELLVRVKACGVCRTDLHVIEGDLTPKKLPLIPGHQVVGIVEQMGPACQRFKIGDRVGIAWLRSTCQNCQYCLGGRENLCTLSTYTGYQAHGGYAEFALAPDAYAYKIPEIYSDTEATPLLCAGIIGYRALLRSAVKPRERLGIFGFGSSAHLTIQVAIHRGCEVFVATRDEKHRNLARSLGATWVGDTSDPMPEKIAGAIVFAPVGEIVPIALRALQSGGTVALAGIHMSEIPAMGYEAHLFHEKALCSVEANTRKDGHDLLSEAAQIPIRPKVQTFALEAANEVLSKLKHDGLNGTGVLVME